MPQDGEIILEKLKAYYSIEDINLVDKNKIDQAGECRLYFEIFWGVGLTILGNLISYFNWPLFITCAVCICLGSFFLIRYIRKNSQLNKKIIKLQVEPK
jgi:hypothetical protein